jgi:hypothetical protein
MNIDTEYSPSSYPTSDKRNTKTTSRMNQIVHHIRENSSNIRVQVPQYLDDTDFVPLENDDSNDQNFSFVYDTEGEMQQSFKCPDNIEDMLLIVRQLQSQVEKALPTFEFTDPNRTSLYNTETNWSNSSQSTRRYGRPTSNNKSSNNDYDQSFN